MSPQFSVIVPTFNQARYLPAALESLITQSDPDWEAIVINDGSIDETDLILSTFAERDGRIKVYSQSNRGVSAALNHGLDTSEGKWILWLSSDDLFEPHRLETLAQEIARNPTALFFHGTYTFLDDRTGERSTPVFSHTQTADYPALELLRGNFIGGISVAMKRELVNRVGRFDEAKRYGQDHGYWLKASLVTPFHYVTAPTVVTRNYSDQATRLYPERGNFDSALNCMELLNVHPFGDFLPGEGTVTPEIGVSIAERVVSILEDRRALLIAGGGSELLATRFQEWVVDDLEDDARNAVVAFLETRGTDMPRLTGLLAEPLNQFEPFDPRQAMETEYDRAIATRRYPEALLMSGYFRYRGWISDEEGARRQKWLESRFSVRVRRWYHALRSLVQR